MSNTNLIPAERIERQILLIRGQKVLLDFQLAELYEVETKALNQAVKRNVERFPEDFMFQLSCKEWFAILRSQIVTSSDDSRSRSQTVYSGIGSKSTNQPGGMWSQIVTTSDKFRRTSHRPYAFTEQGVAMLSSVLRSTRAVQVNIAIMRTLILLRQLLATHADLARKLSALEEKYDEQFKIVFDAIRELMSKPEPIRPEHGRQIGFHSSTNSSERTTVKRRKKLV